MKEDSKTIQAAPSASPISEDPRAVRAPTAPALGTPFDAMRKVLQATWGGWALTSPALEGLLRVQVAALDRANDSFGRAMEDAARAADFGDLGKVQMQWAAAMLEQSVDFARDWIALCTDAMREAGPVRAEPGATGTAPPAADDASWSNGSTSWPTELALTSQRAWAQWARQWTDMLNHGPIPV
jgi:hypothetical protein